MEKYYPKKLNKWQRFVKNIKKDKQLVLICLPTVIGIFLLKYLPLPGLLMAFQNFRIQPGRGFFYSLFFSERWVGLDNFEFIFNNPSTSIIFRNTIAYNLVFIFVGLIAAVVLAIIIKEIYNDRLRKIFQTLMFFPYFLSWISVAFIFTSLLSTDTGFINGILENLGLDRVNWYQTAAVWPAIIIITGIWKSVGYSSIVYLSALLGIDRSLYEAASIDGASKWKQAIHITVPSIKPLMIILSILAVGRIMSADFGLFYHVPRQSAALENVTLVFDIFTFRVFRLSGDAGLSTAATLFQSAVGFALIMITNYAVKKIDEDYGFF